MRVGQHHRPITNTEPSTHQLYRRVARRLEGTDSDHGRFDTAHDVPQIAVLGSARNSRCHGRHRHHQDRAQGTDCVE